MSESNTGKKKALVISISDYVDIEIPKLEFCKNDGEVISETLSQIGYEINKKFIGIANGDEFKNAIIDFFRDKNLTPTDTLLFYFSGHGLSDGWGGKYFATTDVNKDIPERNGVPFNFLIEQMEKSKAFKKIAIIDCCYSGSAHPGIVSKAVGDPEQETEKIGREDLKIFEKSQGVCILASSLSNKLSYFIKEERMSTFTHYVIEGLKGNKDSVDEKGDVTPQKLEEYAFSQMLKFDPNLQRPISNFSISGKIILAEYPNLISIDPNPTKKRIDFSSFVTIRNMGPDVAGLTFAAVYAMEIALAQKGNAIHLSVRYIYEKSKTKDEIPDDVAMKAKSISYVIQEFGTVLDSVWPFEPNARNLPMGKTWGDLDTMAINYKARTFYLISFDDIFTHLINGRAITISHPIFSSFGDPSISAGVLYPDNEKFIIPVPLKGTVITKERLIGYHMTTIVGFDPEESLFKCANMWGTDWGSKGFFYMRENDARRIIDIENSFAVDMEKPMYWK